MKQVLGVGSKVQINNPMPVPSGCEWDDDRGRVSTHAKKKILEKFFKGDRKLTCEIVHVSKESEREKLRKSGMVKVRVREGSGATIVIPVSLSDLKKST